MLGYNTNTSGQLEIFHIEKLTFQKVEVFTFNNNSNKDIIDNDYNDSNKQLLK